MLLMEAELKHALDPVLWASECLGFNADPWQIQALRSTAKQSLWNIHRQAGKSSIAALKALWMALFQPGSLTLVISPSERQSGELYKKFSKYYDRLDNPPGMPEDKALSCTLGNDSRVVALPGIEDTVRCYSGVTLLIEDEASHVKDDLYFAIRPMLAVSNGQIILLSTPFGKRGHFWTEWSEGEGWEKIAVSVHECSRISKEFLDSERRSIGNWTFSQEYENQFVQTTDDLFNYDEVIKAFSSNVKPIEVDKPWNKDSNLTETSFSSLSI